MSIFFNIHSRVQQEKSTIDAPILHTTIIHTYITVIVIHIKTLTVTVYAANLTVLVLACFHTYCIFIFMHTLNCAPSLITCPQWPQGVNNIYFSCHTHNTSHEPNDMFPPESKKAENHALELISIRCALISPFHHFL